MASKKKVVQPEEWVTWDLERLCRKGISLKKKRGLIGKENPCVWSNYVIKTNNAWRVQRAWELFKLDKFTVESRVGWFGRIHDDLIMHDDLG